MKIVKFTFVIVVMISLCSFAFFSENNLDTDAELYKEFLSKFEAVEIPLQLKFEVPTKNKKDKERPTLGNKFASFIPGISVSIRRRTGPDLYAAETLLASTDKYQAVIFSRSNGYRLGSEYFVLATYDKNGKNIATERLGRASSIGYLDLNVSAKMEMTAIEMETEESDLAEKSYFPKKTRKIFVTPKGEIMVHDDIKAKPLDTKENKPQLQKVG